MKNTIVSLFLIGTAFCQPAYCDDSHDAAKLVLSRQMVLTNNLLNLPVKNGSPQRRFTVTVGGKAVRDFTITLADGAADWWAFVDVSAFRGRTATLSVDSLPAGSTGLSSVLQSNDIVGG